MLRLTSIILIGIDTIYYRTSCTGTTNIIRMIVFYLTFIIWQINDLTVMQ